MEALGLILKMRSVYMLREERHQHILEMLNRDKKVIATELSEKLMVSEDTIRRDLREMDHLGLLHRVHGGALPKPPSAVHYEDRQKDAVEIKEQLAEAAISLIRKGQVILMDGSTSNLRVAERLPAQLEVTVFTNSPPIAIALASHPKAEVIMIGGSLFKDALVNVGVAAIEALNKVRADLYFLGVYAIHPEIGMSVPFLDESYVKRQMIASAAETVGLVTSAKMGTSSTYVVAPASSLTYMVTEKQVPDETLQPYRNLGVTVIQG